MFKKIQLLRDIQWGARGMVALYLSLLSGVVIALQYNFNQPFYSTSIIDTLVPFGEFWRSLHFYSSQVFFIFIVLHFVAVLWNKSALMSTGNWLRLVASMLVVILLLFTGYILRADATGSSAGRIAENIILSIPYGRILDSLLFDIKFGGLKRVYVNHIVGLGLVWLFLIWPHIRRYTVNWRQFPWLIFALSLWSALIPAPMEPARIGVFNITGPWFFIGLQELLRYLPPIWAGVIWPSIFVVGLSLLSPDSAWRKKAVWLVVFWLVVYLFLTILGLMVGAGQL